MTRFITFAFLSVCLLVCPHSGLAAPFGDLIVFGDSLSDTGNVARITGGLVPSEPYYQGRFTNGPNYVDYMASALAQMPRPILQEATISPLAERGLISGNKTRLSAYWSRSHFIRRLLKQQIPTLCMWCLRARTISWM